MEVSLKSVRNCLAGRGLVALGVSLGLALASVAAADEWYERDDWEKEDVAERMIADTLVVRPVGIAGTVLGAVSYVISLPFSYFGGNQYEAQEALVEDPVRHTFQRPLGRDF
jgi:hypothetical protein